MFDFDDIFKSDNYLKIIFALIVFILFSIYLYSLLFGERSFSRLVELRESEKAFKKEVKTLKKQNEILQKEYFELKELEGK